MILPTRTQTRVNWLWLGDIGRRTDPREFIRESDPGIKASRLGLTQLLAKILPLVCKIRHIDAIATCTFYYKQDRDWERAAVQSSVPFFVFQKENMQDPVIQEASVKRYVDLGFMFSGTHMFVANRLQRDVVLRAKVCGPDNVTAIGSLRMDDLQRTPLANLKNHQRKMVLLLSFHHAVGLLQIPAEDRESFFSISRKDGFVDYFDIVHRAIIRLSKKRPDIDVVIKTKWAGRWIQEIQRCMSEELGSNASLPENLEILSEGNTQDLLGRANVIVGINSTALLEGMVLGKSVVVPLFAEAGGKYFQNHVYFKQYLDNPITTARSPDTLLSKIGDALEVARPPKVPETLIDDYLGKVDGSVAETIVSLMRSKIYGVNNQHIGSRH